MTFAALFAMMPERPVREAPFAVVAIFGFFVEMAVLRVKSSHVCRFSFLIDTS
jgi:hypothetical protein